MTGEDRLESDRILEGIVTTLGPDSRVNISPMGPRVALDMRRMTLRPYRTSQTYKNLKSHGEGVFHVTDDVELLARSAVGDATAELTPAKSVRGFILAGACRAYEIRVTSIDDDEERTTIEAEVVHCERLRDYFGLNRAKHAVVEAAILATRIHLLPIDEIVEKYSELEVLVRKTGGPAEARAFAFLEDHIRSARGELPAGRVRVVTGSRLHFGLISPGAETGRSYGGAGVMVDLPAIDLRASSTREPSRATGPLADRALEMAHRAGGGRGPRCLIEILDAPRDHTGLGTGTQLGLAVARAITSLHGEGATVAQLAARTGRGRRSAIGVHGFERGGFLVDGGKPRSSEAIAPLLVHRPVPESWRFVLSTPRGAAGIHGRAEEESFRSVADGAECTAQALCRTLLLGLAPAIAEEDIAAFGEALYEYGVKSGELFKRTQGGIFAGPEIEALVGLIRAEGVQGAGQSSWGPTVYGVVKDEDAARHLAGRIERRFGAGHVEVTITAPRNRGASLSFEASGTEGSK